MGFFSSLWEGIKTAAAITIGAPIAIGAWAADKVGIIDLDGKNSNEVRQNVDKISNNIGRSEALTETSTTQQVENLSNLVRQYYREYRPQAESIEVGCRKRVDDLIDSLIDHLRKNEELTESFGLDSIQRSQRNLGRKINGAITGRLEMDLSLDNYECREILKMSPGPAKDRRMKEYANQVISEAKEDLAKTVSRILYDQIDDISDFLERQLDKQERETKNAQKEFDSWAKDMENNAFNQELAQLQPAVKLYAIEQLEKIIKNKAA